jgi:hypothetical protein
LKSKSEYLNLAELERLLQSKDYSQLRNQPSSILDRKRLFVDLRSTTTCNKKLQSFLESYLNTRLDVVSLAEARETVANAPTSSLFDEKLQAQVKSVLDFAEESLRGVPHSRREHITLGDYIQRHNYISNQGTSAAASNYLPDLLKRRINQIVGQALDIEDSTIDWELAGVRTNPIIHK